MRIASIGDLHLASNPRQDKHWGAEDALLELLSHLTASHETIVLLGDVYQADFGPRVGGDPDLIAGIEHRYRRAFDLIRSGPFIQIPGNHDQVAEGRLGLARQVRVEREGWRILFEHGHRFDRSVAGLCPDLMMWTMGRLRQLGFRRFCDFFESSVLEPLHALVLGDALERGAAGLVREEGWDVVVMGHTHRTMCVPMSGNRGIYVNAGACTARHPRFLSIDTEAATVVVRELTGPGDGVILGGCASRPAPGVPTEWRMVSG